MMCALFLTAAAFNKYLILEINGVRAREEPFDWSDLRLLCNRRQMNPYYENCSNKVSREGHIIKCHPSLFLHLWSHLIHHSVNLALNWVVSLLCSLSVDCTVNRPRRHPTEPDSLNHERKNLTPTTATHAKSANGNLLSNKLLKWREANERERES